MKTMNANKHDESGSITIIAAIMVLLIVTLVGISAMNTTTVELQIAGNDQRSRIAFYNADSGVYGIPKIISRTVDTSEPVGVAGETDSIAAGVTWNAATDQDIFFDQVMGFDTYDPTPDVAMGQGGFSTEVDVERVRSRVLSGGGAEFASGTEGVGVGTTGGVAVFYELDSRGQSTRGAVSNVIADYRKVVGVPGGL
jgi:type IV pilus assembly PilX-like protein